MFVCTVNVQTKKFIYHLHSKIAFQLLKEENAVFPFNQKVQKKIYILLQKLLVCCFLHDINISYIYFTVPLEIISQ